MGNKIDSFIDIKNQILRWVFVLTISVLPCLRLQDRLKCSPLNPSMIERVGVREVAEALGEKFEYAVSPEGSFGIE